MKKLTFIGALIVTSILTQAQNNTIDLEQPVLEFKTEIIDYGTIEQGSDGVREFEFTNTGSAPLIVSNVESACGCTVPSYPKEPIMPGKTGTIKVKYDTKRIGAINKAVTLVSNAKRPRIVLRIKGKVMAAEIAPVKKTAIPQTH